MRSVSIQASVAGEVACLSATATALVARVTSMVQLGMDKGNGPQQAGEQDKGIVHKLE